MSGLCQMVSPAPPLPPAPSIGNYFDEQKQQPFQQKKSQRLLVCLTSARICRWTKINCLRSFLAQCSLKEGATGLHSSLPPCSHKRPWILLVPTAQNQFHSLSPTAQGSSVTALGKCASTRCLISKHSSAEPWNITLPLAVQICVKTH